MKRIMRGRVSREGPSRRALALPVFRHGLIGLAGLAVGVFLYWAGPDLANRMIPAEGPGEIKKSSDQREPSIDLGPSPRVAPTDKQEGPTAAPDTDKNATQTGSQEGSGPKSGETILQTIKVAKGQTLSKLAIQYYGKSNESLVDLILTHNPSITDADLILVDQEIRLPQLKEEALLFPASDHTFSLHLGTFPSLKKASQFRNGLALPGKRIAVQPREFSPRKRWYRVEVVPYQTDKEALAAIRMLREKGLLPFF